MHQLLRLSDELLGEDWLPGWAVGSGMILLGVYGICFAFRPKKEVEEAIETPARGGLGEKLGTKVRRKMNVPIARTVSVIAGVAFVVLGGLLLARNV